MATSAQTRPEPMNSSPHHAKVNLSMTLAQSIYVAGKFVAGKMEVECRADKGLGIGVIMIELFAMQELISRDHSATSRFLHSRRLFQGPDLPPSNAVQAHPLPGDPTYPPHYHQARRGISTFLFRIPLPMSAPSSISFGSDLARVRYELRATVGVLWKGEKTLVVCKREIDVVESFEENILRTIPEGVVVGEFGKIWVQGRVVGGIAIAGETACLELHVKNHSNKKNTGLTLSLIRSLVLPGLRPGETSPLQISDNLTTVSFRDPEYIIVPGVEGIASLVFDVPEHARGVRAGPYEGDESENRSSQSIFEVRCVLEIIINMGLGSKDIHLDIPVTIVHPDAIPELTEFTPYPPPEHEPLPHHLQSTNIHPGLPMSPSIPAAYIDPVQNQVWLPPPPPHTPYIHDSQAQYYFPPPPPAHIPANIPTRPLSAGPTDQPLLSDATGLSAEPVPQTFQHLLVPFGDLELEEGKGERATRVTQHLRMSSRHRSVSPQSHRFPLPVPPVGATRVPLPIPPSVTEQLDWDDPESLPSGLLLLPAASPPETGAQSQVPLPVPPLAAERFDWEDCGNSLSGPLLLPVASPSETAAESLVHSPRPFLSPKRSFDISLPKSERVEELERMAQEVEKTTLDLSSDLPKTTFEPSDSEPVPASPSVSAVQVHDSLLAEPNINKTLPVPPPVTKNGKDKGNAKSNVRTRIDEFFANPPPIPTEPKAPKTPMAAVTPVKLPFKPKSAEFKAQQHPGGHTESGLDALEKRLLAEVGTRKMELANERRPAWSIVGAKPIDIPSKESVPEGPLNDSAISSLTLAGERLGIDREDVEFNGMLDVDVEHDSDEKTHRAGKSTASAGSRKDSKEKGEKGKMKGKKDKNKDRTQDRGKDVEGHHTRKKKTIASKGRVAAWLGAIDPDVPPEEDVLPPSPAVSRKVALVMESNEGLPPVADADVTSVASKSTNAIFSEDHSDDGASAPNPRSSGFVPIGTFKPGTLQLPLKHLSKDATVVREAKRVTDIWSGSARVPATAAPLKATLLDNRRGRSPAMKDVPPDFESSFPSPQSFQTDRKVMPPPLDGAVDRPSANAGKLPGPNIISPNVKKPLQPPPRLAALITPQHDAEVKYNVQSARGGRGGRVTAITSFWAAGAAGSSSQPMKDNLAQSKPLQDRVSSSVVNDIPLKASTTDSSPVTPKLAPRTPIKSLLTTSAPTTLPPNTEPRPVDFVCKAPRPLVKSTSVPAIISSSHAIPMLSSTASLARPTSVKPQTPKGRLPPTISEVRPDSGRRILEQASAKVAESSSSKPRNAGEMAFGQARLRDLIKKYQGQAV